MGTRGIAVGLKIRKDIIIRAAGFTTATVVVCGALAVGSILRDPSRSPSQSAAVSNEDGKDQDRIFFAGDRSPATPIHNVSANAAEAEPIGEWREQEFTFIMVVDGRTFASGGVTIRLAGVELPPPDQVCRTLDDRLEQCAARAATQLELLTRSRTLACRYRMTTSSEAIGACRIGPRDLAERMVRTGYVRAEGAGGAVLAKASGIEPAQ